MSEFIDIGATSQFKPGTLSEVKMDGHDLLVANVAGALFVADAHCPHLHANLTKGTLDGTVLTCPLHGSQFDLTDGSCVRWTNWSGAVKSMAEFVRHPRPLRVYETRIEADRLLVGPQKVPPNDQPASA